MLLMGGSSFMEIAVCSLAVPLSILSAYFFSRICVVIVDYLKQSPLKESQNFNFCKLSTLDVGQQFTIPDDEYNLWEVIYFDMHDVLVSVVGTPGGHWLRGDLEVKIFPLQ